MRGDRAEVVADSGTGVLKYEIEATNASRPVGAYREIARLLKPGGRVQFADICVEKPVPESALGDIDLWTG